jgi:hypothetical protein
LDLLIVIGITSLVQGVYTASVEAEDITEGMERAIGDGICFGVSHVVIGNIKHHKSLFISLFFPHIYIYIYDLLSHELFISHPQF